MTRAHTLLPLANYPVGTREAAGLIVLEDGEDWIEVSAEGVDQWPRGRKDAVRVRADVSYDTGLTWHLLCEYMTGGAAVGPIETGEPRMGARVYGSGARLVRVQMQNLQAVRTGITAVTEDRGIVDAPAEQPRSAVFDAASVTDFAFVSSASWTHVPSGTPSGVGVGISALLGTAAATSVSSVTYGGTSCTEQVTKDQTFNSTLHGHAWIWGLANPSSGNQTVEVTFPATNHYGAAGAITVTGGDTTTLASGTQSAGSETGNATLTITSASDELVMDTLTSFNARTHSVGADQTQRWNAKNAGSNTRGSGSTEPGATSVTMSWTLASGTEEVWAQVAMSFKSAAAAGGSKGPAHGVLLTGVGV